MRPTLSAAIFSSATGAGFGLLALIGIFAGSGLLPEDRGLGAIGIGLALAAVAFGLAAAKFAAGRPESQWPASADWRESWPSRTGILATAAVAAAVLFGFGWVVHGARDGIWRWFGLFAASFSIMAVYSTAMIYGSREETPVWSNRWVLPIFLALALLTGALWLNALALLFGLASPDLAMLAVVALFLSFYLKRKYWRLIDLTAPPAPSGDDIWPEGIQPFPASSVRNRRRTVFIGLFAVPLLLMLVGMGKEPSIAIPCTLVAAISASFGVLVERLLFLDEK